jgi:beta-glucosidase
VTEPDQQTERQVSSGDDPAAIRARVDELMSQMTLVEKAGQLTQYFYFRLPATAEIEPALGLDLDAQPRMVEEALGRGEAGSLLFLTDPAEINRLQRLALAGNRLGIPLLFGFDVIHGLRTIFPVPIAMAASWDLVTIERGQSVAAREARAVGIHWAFAPMVDIARDPRWGRIVEGAGEDPFLGAAVAAAQVRGFQGADFAHPERIIAGPKHFAGYGAAIGGRDYDEVNLSEYELWNTYFPPFQAAVEAGAGNVMTAYMDLNGVPASGSRWLFSEVLRETWGFGGFVVSDANAVRNLVTHGFAADLTDAGAAPSPRASTWRWPSPIRPTRTCPKRSSPVPSPRTSSMRGCGRSSKRNCGWVCSTLRTSMRTAPGRSSPIRSTARWRASPPSGRPCCCATRAACSRSPSTS